MKLDRSKLRLEQLESRENPTAVNIGFGPTTDSPVVTFNVAGYNLLQNNAGYATTSSAFGFNDANMTVSQAVTTANGATVNQLLTDAFDGALSWGLAQANGTVQIGASTTPLTYYDADGIVDIVGTPLAPLTYGAGAILTGDPNGQNFAGDSFNGLQLWQQNAVFSVDGDPVIRSIFFVRNTTGSAITQNLGVFNNLGSDINTKIYATSSGDSLFQPGVDTYVGSFEDYVGTTSPDVRLMFQVQGGFGTIKQGLDASSFYANGINNPHFNFNTTLAAGETKAFMLFTSLHGSKQAGIQGASNYTSLAALQSNGLLAGLDSQTLALIQNWALVPPVVPPVVPMGSPVPTGEVVASSAGQLAVIEIFDVNGNLSSSFVPFEGYTGGVNIARGDYNHDGVLDIVAATATGGSHVKVFSGANGTLLASFFAFEGYTGGVSVAMGDINDDGFDDIIVGQSAGGSHVKVFSIIEPTLLHSFFAFDGYTGGVNVGAGDVNGDGVDDILVGSASVFSHVKAFSGVDLGEIRSFFAFDDGYTGGVSVAGGDLNGDGYDDIVVGSLAGATNVKSYSGLTGAEVASFFAYNGSDAGVNVAVIDADGSGFGDIGTGSRVGSHVKAFDFFGSTEIDSFFAFGPDYTGGIDVG